MTWKVPLQKRHRDYIIAIARQLGLAYRLPMPKNALSKNLVMILERETDAIIIAGFLTPSVRDAP